MKFFFRILIILFLIPTISEAHEPDHSYIYLRVYKDAMGGRFEFTAKDVNRAIGSNIDEELTMESVQPIIEEMQRYCIEHSIFEANGRIYEVEFTETTVLPLKKEPDFLRLHFDFKNVEEVPLKMDITYTALFDKYPRHKGVLVIEHLWKAGIFENEALISNIYGPNNTKQELMLDDVSLWKGFVALVKLGIWHIWIGLDHILFIIALILPSVIRKKTPEELAETGGLFWKPVDKFKPAFLYILTVITFFTIAHSITLALASLNVVNLPSNFVEATIALSIALAAYNNINPIFKHREWVIAFAFGLFHGFGFASVLGDKGLGGDFMVLSLLGFNVGVEIGQVLIICFAFPILFLIRQLSVYKLLLKYGSVLLIFISIYWFIERAFSIDLPLGAYFWKMYNSIF
jgi:hypothetical protein